MAEAIDVGRWRTAQTAESEYWHALRGNPAEFTRVVAENAAAAQWAARHLPELPAGDWVEIGSGPLGIGCLPFLPGADSGRLLVGVDPLPRLDIETLGLPAPLMTLARTVHGLPVEQRQAKGEETGLDSDRFSLAVCYNVLDHVHDPRAILDEVHRVLIPGGFLFLGVDARSLLSDLKYGLWVKRRHADTVGVRAHPHHFRIGELRRTVAAARFEVIAEQLPRHVRLQELAGKAHRLLMLCRKPEGTRSR